MNDSVSPRSVRAFFGAMLVSAALWAVAIPVVVGILR